MQTKIIDAIENNYKIIFVDETILALQFFLKNSWSTKLKNITHTDMRNCITTHALVAGVSEE